MVVKTTEITVEEIEKRVKERQDKTLELRNRFEKDYGYWRLTPYNRGKDYKSVTSNEPRTLADKIVNTLSQAPYQIRIPVDEDLEGERENKSNAERFLIGMLNLINARFKALGYPDFIGQMVWHAVVRGWYGLRAYVVKSKDGSTKPRVDVWDMFNTHYDLAEDGLAWACHLRTASASQILSEYKVEITAKSATMYDFWDDKINSVHFKVGSTKGSSGNFVKTPTEHGLDHVPVFISVTGATPFIESDQYQDTIKDVGASWIAANRELVEPINELYSDLLTIVARGTKIPMKAMSAGGKLTVDDSPWKLDKAQGAFISLDTDKKQDLLPLIEPTMPRDAANIMNAFGALWQQGGLPKGAWGEIAFQISGYLQHQLSQSMASVFGLAGASVEAGGEWLCRELLSQYSQGGFKPVKVEGRDDKNKYFGPIELKPVDVKGDWFPEFKLLYALPQDEMERYAMARIAHEGDNPLLSDLTINEKILLLQDADLEEEKKLEQKANKLPPILLRRLAVALVKRGRPDLAEEILKLLSQSGQPLAPTQPPGAPPASEAVQPEFQTGVPPQVMPPEALGRTQESERMARMGLVRS